MGVVDLIGLDYYHRATPIEHATILRRTTEAEVTCVLKEESDGTVRVSLRSLGDIDVCKIADEHGGGGHSRPLGHRRRVSQEGAARDRRARR